jgi:hypothetical protein
VTASAATVASAASQTKPSSEVDTSWLTHATQRYLAVEERNGKQQMVYILPNGGQLAVQDMKNIRVMENRQTPKTIPGVGTVYTHEVSFRTPDGTMHRSVYDPESKTYTNTRLNPDGTQQKSTHYRGLVTPENVAAMKQGNLGSCAFDAALKEAAEDPEALRSLNERIMRTGSQETPLLVNVASPGEQKPQWIPVSTDSLRSALENNRLASPESQGVTSGNLPVAAIQLALIQSNRGFKDSAGGFVSLANTRPIENRPFTSMDGAHSDEVWRWIANRPDYQTNVVRTSTDGGRYSPDATLDRKAATVSPLLQPGEDRRLSVAVLDSTPGVNDRHSIQRFGHEIALNHAYAVDITTNDRGEKVFQVRNPWHTDNTAPIQLTEQQFLRTFNVVYAGEDIRP